MSLVIFSAYPTILIDFSPLRTDPPFARYRQESRVLIEALINEETETGVYGVAGRRSVLGAAERRQQGRWAWNHSWCEVVSSLARGVVRTTTWGGS